MDSPQKDQSGLQCLQFLFQQVRHNVNFASLIHPELLEKYQQDPQSVLIGLAAEQRLSPEAFAGPDDLGKKED